MGSHNPARYGQDTTITMPHRSRASGTDRERHWSTDETLVGSPSSRSSLHTNRFSTMRTWNWLHIDVAQSPHMFEEGPSNTTSSRQASLPSATVGPQRRNAIFGSTIQEAEEQEPRTSQRASTLETHGSQWWKLRRS